MGRPGSQCVVRCARRFASRLAALLAVSAPVLAALEWQAGQGFRSAAVLTPAGGRPGFTLLGPSATGIAFTNHLAEARWITNTMFLNGAGVAAGDVDGDGWCDLYFCSLDGANALYRNLGEWKFQDITAWSGAACPDLAASGCALADLDGDGDLDLVVNSMGGGTWCLFNDGRGRFTRLTNRPLLNLNKAGESLALGDVDGDGDLDLYVTNYRFWSYRDKPGMKFRVEEIDGKMVVTSVEGRPVTEPDLVGRFTVRAGGGGFEEHGEDDLLALNDGQGRFTPVSWTEGAFLNEDGRPLPYPPYDWGLSVMMRDINGDGAPDLYVCNDFDSPDRVWINDGQGRFRLIPRLAIRSTSIFSMGVDFADVNRDGFDDFFTGDMLSPLHQKRHVQIGEMKPVFLRLGEIEDRPQYSRNMLFLNRGDGTYAEIGCFAGLYASEWSWTTAFLDVDLDGFEDLLVTTGHELDAMNADVTRRAEEIKKEKPLSPLEQLRLRKLFDRLAVREFAFRNRGNLTFEDVSTAWGFDTPSVAHGMALADLDNDGDLDLALNCLNGPAALFRNEATAPRVAVRLKGKAPNTRGIGAKMWLYNGAVPMQSQEIICGGRYLSSDDPARVFAAGSLTNVMRLEVRWRNGARSVLTGVQANRVYEVEEARAAAAPSQIAGGGQEAQHRPLGGAGPPAAEALRASLSDSRGAATVPPLFEDATHLLNHAHREGFFDDFDRQPLLPYRLSQLGPGVAWHDFNLDGWEDLFIASGRGGTLAAFQNTGQGTFTLLTNTPLNRVVGRDQTTVLGVGATLFVGVSNYEDGTTNGGWVGIYDLANRASGESIRGPTASTGPLAMADVDGDGDLDLFVGGRTVAGRYAEPATSLLARNDGGRFSLAQRWDKLGLVSGAVFSDLDEDGDPDLVLACDWGPIRLFKNDGGRFEPWNPPVVWPNGSADHASLRTLDAITGWWHGVSTGDLDSDGRPDIVASNYGLNHRYRATPQEPRRLYYGDLDGNGTVDVVEAYLNPSLGRFVPERGRNPVAMAVPYIQERIPTFEAYGQAGLEDIYGEAIQHAGFVEANTLASMVFLNRGDRFAAVPLPDEAQFAPAFGICIGDADGDGHEDVFLSQNLFAVNPEGWRNDAGRGLWLKGDGTGRLRPMSGQESGVAVYGEQRGCALGDYDGDGRVDLVVTQNGTLTRLFRNVGAKPGLRVRLHGPPTNPAGLGACVRLQNHRTKGPLREIHGGSGYWSLDSAVAVLALPDGPTKQRFLPLQPAPAGGGPDGPTQVWVRWPGGKVTVTDVPQGAREITVSMDGTLKLVKSN